MKKVLSTLVAALVAVSFASIVFAEEVNTDVKSETTTTSPAGEVKVEKKEEAPAAAPAAPAEAPPAQ